VLNDRQRGCWGHETRVPLELALPDASGATRVLFQLGDGERPYIDLYLGPSPPPGKAGPAPPLKHAARWRLRLPPPAAGRSLALAAAGAKVLGCWSGCVPPLHAEVAEPIVENRVAERAIAVDGMWPRAKTEAAVEQRKGDAERLLWGLLCEEGSGWDAARARGEAWVEVGGAGKGETRVVVRVKKAREVGRVMGLLFAEEKASEWRIGRKEMGEGEEEKAEETEEGEEGEGGEWE
jgi:hypothetical protein